MNDTQGLHHLCVALWLIFFSFPVFPDPPEWTGLWRGLLHTFPREVPASAHLPAVSGLWGVLSRQPQGLCGQIWHEWRPGPELPLRQRRGHSQCFPGQGLHRGQPLFWWYETGDHMVILLYYNIFTTATFTFTFTTPITDSCTRCNIVK